MTDSIRCSHQFEVLDVARVAAEFVVDELVESLLLLDVVYLAHDEPPGRVLTQLVDELVVPVAPLQLLHVVAGRPALLTSAHRARRGLFVASGSGQLVRLLLRQVVLLGEEEEALLARLLVEQLIERTRAFETTALGQRVATGLLLLPGAQRARGSRQVAYEQSGLSEAKRLLRRQRRRRQKRLFFAQLRVLVSCDCGNGRVGFGRLLETQRVLGQRDGRLALVYGEEARPVLVRLEHVVVVECVPLLEHLVQIAPAVGKRVKGLGLNNVRVEPETIA